MGYILKCIILFTLIFFVYTFTIPIINAQITNNVIGITVPEMILVEGYDGRRKFDNTNCTLSSNFEPSGIETFWIGKYEITNEQCCLFLNSISDKLKKYDIGPIRYQLKTVKYNDIENNVFIPHESFEIFVYGENSKTEFKVKPGFELYPCRGLTYLGAVEFCKWLTGLTGNKYGLPSLNQWEFAYIGGNKSNNYKYSGSDTLIQVAVYSEYNARPLMQVGSKKPNELGIYDMAGNLTEMTSEKFYVGQEANRVKNGELPPHLIQTLTKGSSYQTIEYECEKENSEIVTFSVDSDYGFRVICYKK